jgi:FkbM family methyltransferase
VVRPDVPERTRRGRGAGARQRAHLRGERATLGVQVVEAAIGSSSGFVEVGPRRQGVGHPRGLAYSTVRSGTGTVAVVTVQDVLQEQDSRTELFLVKVDIEGFESDLFQENTEWVDHAAAVIVEPHDWMDPQRTSGTFQRVFGELNFDLLVSGENLVYVRRPDGE